MLDLCGGTGAWSEPYRHDNTVVLVTLPKLNVLATQFTDTHLIFTNFENDDYRIYIRIEDIGGILAAPPCTMFSIARRTAKTLPDFKGAMEVVEACLKIIWHVRTYGRPQFWAMENPTGLLRQFIGKPAYSFQQWQYGEPLTKRTDLWGYFNEPKPTVKVKPETNIDAIWSNPHKDKHPNLDRTARRAITPQGFAQAFFKANNSLRLPQPPTSQEKEG